jgi:hypothetical protein
MITRRRMLITLAAPAIVRIEWLMPVRGVIMPIEPEYSPYIICDGAGFGPPPPMTIGGPEPEPYIPIWVRKMRGEI